VFVGHYGVSFALKRWPIDPALDPAPCGAVARRDVGALVLFGVW